MTQPAFGILKLIDTGMNETLHWFPESVSLVELAETMAAIANTKGGEIYLGVSPRTGKILGSKDLDAQMDLAFQAALLTMPALVLPIPSLEEVEGKHVLCIRIPSGLPHIYTVGGRYLGRDGHQNVSIPPAQLRRKLHERGILQFESIVPEAATLDDLNFELIESYAESLKIQPWEDLHQLLLQRGCLVREQDTLKPTNAALLLFGKQPQRWAPNAIVLAARFSGPAISDAFLKQEITGTLAEQLAKAETFIKENLETSVRLSGLTREERPAYPFEAVRELLVNAIAHRDYSIEGDTVHLHIFSSRLEVHSPGLLPGPVTLSNLLEARFSRNPIIVQVLSDMGFIERLGYGLDRVVQVLSAHNMQAPGFQEIAGTFRVTLAATPRLELEVASASEFTTRREALMESLKTLNLNSRQKNAAEFVLKNERITNRDYQAISPDVHAETLRRDLSDLVKKEVLLKIGHKRGTYYILKQTF